MVCIRAIEKEGEAIEKLFFYGSGLYRPFQAMGTDTKVSSMASN